MPVFAYVAKTTSGESRSGLVDARSIDLAVTLLKQQGLFVVQLAEKRDSIIDSLLDFRGISVKELVVFTRQFSTMISAGLPIARALEVLSNQSTNKKFRNVTSDVLRNVEGGASLSQAIGRYPEVFSETYQALIKAGETSGRLDAILQRLSATMESDSELNGKFKAALVYPAIVMIAMFGVFVVLMVYVIPKLSELYTNMNVELPIVTKIMIVTSDFMVNNLFLLSIAFVAALGGIKYFLGTALGRRFMIEVSFRTPVFGKINTLKEQAQFTRTLSLLISAAVPIVESLNIVSNVSQSRSYKNAALEAARQVEKGNPLSNFFRNSPIFPPLIGQMAGVGEETGKMDEVLDKVSVYYDVEVDNMIKGLTAALEPIILVILGVMVGFMIISIITPIYKITSSL